MRTLLSLTALSIALLLAPGSALADNALSGASGSASSGSGLTATGDGQGASASAASIPCEALNGMPNQLHKNKGGPIRKIIKGIAKETTQDLKDMADDSVFVFSADGFGPDHTTSNTKPYQAYEMTLMNGDIASVTTFPDASFRVNGGTFDGTCACKNATGHYTIFYPNGAKGSLKNLGGGSFEIIRPDNTITVFKKTSAGGWRISNTKTGYAGEMTKDEGDLGWKLGPAGF
jgi:hypothetical protein